MPNIAAAVFGGATTPSRAPRRQGLERSVHHLWPASLNRVGDAEGTTVQHVAPRRGQRGPVQSRARRWTSLSKSAAADRSLDHNISMLEEYGQWFTKPVIPRLGCRSIRTQGLTRVCSSSRRRHSSPPTISISRRRRAPSCQRLQTLVTFDRRVDATFESTFGLFVNAGYRSQDASDSSRWV